MSDRIDEVRRIVGEEMDSLLAGTGKTLTVNVGASGKRVRLSMGDGQDETFVVVESSDADFIVRAHAQDLFHGRGDRAWTRMSAIVTT